VEAQIRVVEWHIRLRVPVFELDRQHLSDRYGISLVSVEFSMQ
jgi:hypothetical protein